MTDHPHLQDFGADPMQVSRWRERLKDPVLFDKKLAEIREKCIRHAELWESASSSSVTNEWYTPARYIEAVHAVFMNPIDLDPASCETANDTIQALDYWSTGGLEKDWRGRVFLNPPYGKEDGASVASLFCQKALGEYREGRVEEAIILVNSNHGYLWQAPLFDFPVCLVNHRIRFVDEEGKEKSNPVNQNMFVYLGDNNPRFAEVFGEIGYVMVPYA